jgi:small subunit ribosomal protein S1
MVNFEELLNEQFKSIDISHGSLTEAKVLRIDNDFVEVNTGFKSTSLIATSEFKDMNGDINIAVGDIVKAIIVDIDNGIGETALSYEQAQRIRVWSELEEMHESGNFTQGKIVERVKGGYTIDLDNVRAFLPGSLVDIRPVREASLDEGQILDLKIVKMDKKRNNIVVSRKAVLLAENSEDSQKIMSSIVEGEEMTGVVKNLTDYGAFIDLGGIDGLLHITDMSWKRVTHPNQVVEVGQQIKIKILSFDKEKHRVSLGLKQMDADPWKKISEEFTVGAKTKGVVTSITDYGCFVEISDGIEGLVHISELDWANRNINPRRLVEVGQEVEVMVLEINDERRRVSLGLKQCKQNPWEAFSEKYKVGDLVEGQVKSTTDFGLFLGIEGGIDGLVHLTDVSWKQPTESILREYSKKDTIKAKILSIDIERERISLGIKQLEEDPLQKYLQNNAKGTLINSKVVEVTAESVHVEIDKDVSGILNLSDFSKEVLKGDTVSSYIVGIDRKAYKIFLSITQVSSEKSSKSTAKDKSKTSAAMMSSSDDEKATIGDLLKKKISDK